MKENSFTIEKVRGRQYPAETIVNADDPAVVANILGLAKCLLDSMEQVARDVDLCEQV